MGRPREFDIDSAVDTAAVLFWQKGYEKTSLEDLTRALKITPPSFYFAFGSKERLFKKVLERYVAMQTENFQRAVAMPTSREVAETLLMTFVDLYTNAAHPGCLCVKLTSPCADENDGVQAELATLRSKFLAMLRKRFKDARAKKDLPASADPGDLARYVLVIASSLAFSAQFGASRKDLQRTVAMAMKSWPH